MAGYLSSPFAITPFGTGTPATAPVPPENDPISALFLNPTSKDNELATEGSYRRMPVTRHRVLVALTTRRGSMASNRRFGLRMPPKVGTGYERQVRIAVQDALRFMVDDGSITLDDVKVEVGQFGRVRLTVSYTDLQTGQQDTSPLVI